MKIKKKKIFKKIAFKDLNFYFQFQIKINTIRDNTQNKELIEMKKAYIHPHYTYPSLYDDIAVVELGRRIVYDYDKV